MDFGSKGQGRRGAAGKPKTKYMIFRLGQKRYALPLSVVKEVIAITDITPLPHVPSFYKGLINLRGQIISVIDLRTKLTLPPSKANPEETCIIISQVGDIQVGSIVDEVVEVVGYEEEDIDMHETDRVNHKGDGVCGVAKDSSGDLTLILDLARALDHTDFKVLKQQNAA